MAAFVKTGNIHLDYIIQLQKTDFPIHLLDWFCSKNR